jgi:hypothetical protein
MSLTGYEPVFHAQIFADKSYLTSFSSFFQQSAMRLTTSSRTSLFASVKFARKGKSTGEGNKHR